MTRITPIPQKLVIIKQGIPIAPQGSTIDQVRRDTVPA
jgi:hypothetical protein